MMILSDKIGRRLLIALGGLNSAIVLSVYAALTAQYLDSDNQAGKAAAVAMIFVFIVGYLFNETATYIYVSEIWPTHIRSKGVAIALMASTAQSSWVVGATPSGIAAIGWKFNLVFIVPVFVASICCFLFLPETMKVPLEGVALLFGDQDELAEVNELMHQQELIFKGVAHHGQEKA